MTNSEATPSQVRVTSFCQYPTKDAEQVYPLVRGELGAPNLGVLVQLPDRGVWSQPIGRSASLLADMGFDLQPHGWRVGVPDGIDARRARATLRSDENLLADILGAETKVTDELKVSMLGPWSLCAELSLGNGEKTISDHGARRDIRQAYAHGVQEHLGRLVRATGITKFTVQLDEPVLDQVLDGRVPTASGYRTIRSIPRSEVREGYTQVLEVITERYDVQVIANLRAEDPQLTERIEFLEQAGAHGFVMNSRTMNYSQWEKVAALVEKGSEIFLQALAPTGRHPGVVEGVKQLLRPWHQLGLSDRDLGALTLMPIGDFAGSSATDAQRCLERLNEWAVALEQTRVDA